MRCKRYERRKALGVAKERPHWVRALPEIVDINVYTVVVHDKVGTGQRMCTVAVANPVRMFEIGP